MDDLKDTIDKNDEDTQTGKYLIFALGNEKFGLDIKHVTEIIGIQEITVMPDIPEYIKGIINLRGKIIPLMDIRLRFHMEEKAYDDRTCIIVINCNDTNVGLIVDCVSEVQTIEEADMTPPPSFNSGTSNRYIKNIGKTDGAVVLILDCEKILTYEELEALQDLNNDI